MSALREVLAYFDIDTAAAGASLSRIDKAMGKTVDTLGALIDHYAGSEVLRGIREFVAGQIEVGAHLQDLSNKLGVGVDDLQQFQFAASLVGVGADEAAKGLQFLNKNIGEAIGGNKEAAQTFAKLGVQLKDSNGNVRETSDILPEVADAFEECGSDAERTALAMKIFGRAGASLIPLLKEGGKGLREMSAEYTRLGGGIREDVIKASKQAADEIEKVRFAFNGWKSQIAFAILPAIIKFAHTLQTAIGTLRKITGETRLAEVAWLLLGTAAVVAGFKAASGFAKMLGVLPKSSSVWESLLGLGEIGLVIIAVLALVLVFEDFYTMLQGGDSVIGDVIESLFGVGATKDVIEEVRAEFAEFSAELEAFKPIVEEFGVLFGEAFQLALPLIKILVKFWFTSLANSLTLILGIVRTLMSELGAGLQLFGRFSDGAGTFAKLVGNDEIGDELKRFGTAFAKTGSGISAATAGTVPGSQIDGGERAIVKHTENNTEINIQGVPDAPAAGDAARRGVVRALQQSDNDDTFNALATGS